MPVGVIAFLNRGRYGRSRDLFSKEGYLFSVLAILFSKADELLSITPDLFSKVAILFSALPKNKIFRHPKVNSTPVGRRA